VKTFKGNASEAGRRSWVVRRNRWGRQGNAIRTENFRASSPEHQRLWVAKITMGRLISEAKRAGRPTPIFYQRTYLPGGGYVDEPYVPPPKSPEKAPPRRSQAPQASGKDEDVAVSA
jgi:hypothetical protein